MFYLRRNFWLAFVLPIGSLTANAAQIQVGLSSAWTNVQDGGTSDRSMSGTFTIDLTSGAVTVTGVSTATLTGGNNAVRYGTSVASYTNVICTTGVQSATPFTVSFTLSEGQYIYQFNGNSGPNTPIMQAVYGPFTLNPVAQNPPVTPLKSKPLQITNTFTRPLVVNYRDKVTGELLYTTTLAGGETLMHTFQNPNGNNVTVDYALPEGAVFKSLDQNGSAAFFSYQPGTTWSGADMTAGTDFSATPPAWQAASSSTPAPATATATPTAPPTATAPAGSSTSTKAVGGKTNIVYTTNVTDGTVTDKTVREGNSGIVDKLDSVQKAVESVKDADKAARDAVSAKASADEEARATATVGGVSGGTAAKTQAQGLFTGTAPTPPNIEAGTSSPLSVQMPAAFGGATFSFNPFAGDRFGAIMAWFRTATQWAVLVALGAWMWAQIDIKTVQATAMQQAKGNPVAAGTGGQVTALVAAAAITVAVVGLMTALLAWSWGDLTITYLTSLASSNPLVSIPSGVLWMLNQALPVATIVTAFVAKVSWRFYSVPLFAGAAAVVRFVVP